jgi:hypothetical protein
MRYYILFTLLFLLSNSIRSDDLNSPAWRGIQGSTFQQWDFHFISPSTSRQYSASCVSLEGNKTPWGHRGPPDQVDNPFQEQSGVCVEYKTMWALTDQIEWLKEYNGRQGVWRLNIDPSHFNSIEFIIPNKFSQKVKSKETQVQITYEGVKLHPIVRILILLPGKDTGYTYLKPENEYQSGVLPEGWLHRTFSFKTDFCPGFENVQISSPDRGEIYIDKVVVDTICRKHGDDPIK